MSGYALLMAECIGCGVTFTCSPAHVPSIVVNGTREPLCRACYHRWNQIHRTSKGLAPIPLHPQAYEACPEEDCP